MNVIVLLLLSLSSTAAHSPINRTKFIQIQHSFFKHRIIGGEDARSSQFPYIAAIYLDTDDGKYFCGGSLIHNQWMLTAASCVQNVKLFTIQLGSVTLTGDDPNRVTLATVNAVAHPLYNPETLEHNIALIKLRLPIEFNEHIGAIPLPASDPGYAGYTAVGWGQTSDFAGGIVNELQYVSLVVITNEESKLGDNGGPLIAMFRGGFHHAGVASFVSRNGCETPEPSGFTRTYRYVDWIKEITKVL